MGWKDREPRRPKDFLLGWQKCLQRSHLKHDHLKKTGDKTACRSPGVFFHQQFSLNEFVIFTNFYKRIMHLSPNLYSKMIVSAGSGIWISQSNMML